MAEEPLLTRDEELIRQFKSGRTEAFDEMVLTYSPKLYRVAYGLLGNQQDAEEVVQDAFVRAYRALKDFRGEASFKTWMHRITVNLARNKFHWNQRRGEDFKVSLTENVDDPDFSSDQQEMDLPDTALQPGQQLEAEEIKSNILLAMSYLPVKLREAMVLRHVEDQQYEEIATTLKCAVGTVKSRLSRGRELLRAYLNALNEGRPLESVCGMLNDKDEE